MDECVVIVFVTSSIGYATLSAMERLGFSSFTNDEVK